MSIDRSEWIKMSSSGTFTCQECENESLPLTNSEEGMIEANIDNIKSQLEEYSTKVIYGVCPVCGMEYVFKLFEGNLYLEPSNEEK